MIKTKNKYGDKIWKNEKGQYHRNDGPAIEYANGVKQWYKYNELHRENGPAIEWVDGSKEWWVDGNRHREDGPAIEYADGTKYWFYNGKMIGCSSQEKFERMIELLIFE